MCLSWRSFLRNYPKLLCESPVLKETIPLAYLGLLFTDNCCKQASLTMPALSSSFWPHCCIHSEMSAISLS